MYPLRLRAYNEQYYIFIEIIIYYAFDIKYENFRYINQELF